MLYYAYIVNRWQKWGGGGGGIEEARGPGGDQGGKGAGGVNCRPPP